MPSLSAAEYQRALSEIEGAELAEEFVQVSPEWGSLIVAPGPMARQWLKANGYEFIARRGPISAWLNRELGVIVSVEGAGFGNVVTVGFTEPGKIASNPGTVTGYHIGDFIEFFKEDAKTVSKATGMTLTKTGKWHGSLPVTGFPAHMLSTFEPILEAAGLTLVVKEGWPSFIKGSSRNPDDPLTRVKWKRAGHPSGLFVHWSGIGRNRAKEIVDHYGLQRLPRVGYTMDFAGDDGHSYTLANEAGRFTVTRMR